MKKKIKTSLNFFPSPAQKRAGKFSESGFKKIIFHPRSKKENLKTSGIVKGTSKHSIIEER